MSCTNNVINLMFRTVGKIDPVSISCIDSVCRPQYTVVVRNNLESACEYYYKRREVQSLMAATNKTTSPRVAKIASKALSKDSSSKVTKTLAGTALSQAKPSKKGK